MDRYRTATALPFANLHSATSELRRELGHRIMDGDESLAPDWSTLRVVGPFEVFDRSEAIRFEYRASVLPRRLDTRPNLRGPAVGMARPAYA